jgi:RHS repeat-associated protein
LAEQKGGAKFEEGTFVPAAKITEKQKLSIATNYMGTPEAMYRKDGEAVWKCELNSYGKVRKFQGEYRTDCPFRYQGQYEDSETGLYYNRFRYYSLEEGMYISQDPVRLQGGFTLYSYVNDINTQLDIFGLKTCKELADEAHAELDPIAQRQKTTAVGEDEDGNLYIASSDKVVPPVQRKWAERNEIQVVNGVGHAEATLMDSNNNITHVDASRRVCSNCETQMKEQSVTTNTPLKRKP